MNEQPPTVNRQPSTVKRQLHLCDFDGTLVRGDSLARFLLFAIPVPILAGGSFLLVFKFLWLLLIGRWTNEKAKEMVCAALFQGKSETELRVLGERFCREKLPPLIRGELLEKLRAALQAGDTVYIVSASPDVWLRPFCSAQGFGLLCTEWAFEAGVFSGHFVTPNCNGEEKARRILAACDVQAFEKVCAYGNSSGDAAMFGLADEVFKF